MTTSWGSDWIPPAPRPAADEELSRLARFQKQHPPPDVTVLLPSSAHARWRAFIAAGTVPGDDRAKVITDPDLAAFTGKLEQLFSLPRPRPG